MKRLFTLLAERWEREARIGSDRAIPDLDLPRLDDLDRVDLLSRQLRLAAVFVARFVLGLAGMVWAIVQGNLPVLAIATFFTYGGALTTVHHLIHGGLGLPPAMRHALRTVAAAVTLESGSALYATHTLHHVGDPDAPDPEGAIEEVPWRRLPLEAVLFRYRLMAWGWRHAAQPARVRAEVWFHIAFHVVALALLPVTPYPAIYVAAMFVASSSFAVLAARGPQTNFGRPIWSPLVAVRGRFSRLLFFSHDRHLEHHAYPEVPLPRLRQLDAELATRWPDVHSVDGAKLDIVTVRFL